MDASTVNPVFTDSFSTAEFASDWIRQMISATARKDRRYPGSDASSDWVEQSILQMGELQDDWDGFGAAGINKEIVARGIALSNAIATPPTDVNPHPAGTLVFEWETHLGKAYLEIGRTRYNFYARTNAQARLAHAGFLSELTGGKIAEMSVAIDSVVSVVHGAAESFPIVFEAVQYKRAA